MGELIIRRNRSFAVPQYQEVSKAEKPAGSGRSQKAAGTAAAAAPEALLMSRGIGRFKPGTSRWPRCRTPSAIWPR